jgi:hypothetical protein
MQEFNEKFSINLSNVDTTKTMATLDTFLTEYNILINEAKINKEDSCCYRDFDNLWYSDTVNQVLLVPIDYYSTSSYCCEVEFIGYGETPLPGVPPLLIFTTEGYNIVNAKNYKMHLIIYHKIFNSWQKVHDRLWPDFERLCNGQLYGVGYNLQLILGDCPGIYKAYLSKAHTNEYDILEYCIGDNGTFYYPGYPQICDWH